MRPALAIRAESEQNSGLSNHRSEGFMSHSKMLTTRRRKKKAQTESDRLAKAAKKMGKAGVRTSGKTAN